MIGFRGFSLALVVFIISSPLPAHHGVAAYDTKNPVSLMGAVTEWDWANPHCILQFDVRDSKDQVLHWTAETSSPADMVNHGWNKLLLKPGDQVTVTLEPAKNGKPIGRVVEVILSDGQRLTGGFLGQSIPNAGASGGTKPNDSLKK
jgi:hypothetical protein